LPEFKRCSNLITCQCFHIFIKIFSFSPLNSIFTPNNYSPTKKIKKIMKNLFVLFAALLITVGASAQADKKMKDGYMMKDGKMWVMKAGTTTEMKSDATLKNGTTITTKGAVTPKGGKPTMLKNGDWVEMDGTMGSMPAKGK
jgi:hypothetical protein